MKLFISKQQDEITDETLRAHVERRARFAFARFADALGTVRVRLEDINGPRGGLDKRCVVHIRGPGFGELVVERIDSAWGGAIDRALSLSGRAVAKSLGRLRPMRRRVQEAV